MDKINGKFNHAYSLIKEANKLINDINNNTNDISHLHGYKCMVSKNNKHLHSYVGENSKNIYLNSRKVWYENTQLENLKGNSFYYLIAYVIIGLFLLLKLFTRPSSNKLMSVMFVIIWPFLGYYGVIKALDMYTFLYNRFFINDVYINLANKF